jgi:hypothetical protein
MSGVARAVLVLVAIGAVAAGGLIVLEVAQHPPTRAHRSFRVPSAPRSRASRERSVSRSGAPGHGRRVNWNRDSGRAPSSMGTRIGPLLPALEVVAGLVAAAAIALVGLIGRHLWLRRHRRYELFELHLSTHDHAKAQDLEDMVESMANIVRAWPADRMWRGQPSFAVELICDRLSAAAGAAEMEWSINVRCEPASVEALDGAISAAYPDVRLGRTHGEPPRARGARLRTPGHVIRFCKERSFVYPLLAAEDLLASPPLEQIAFAQINAHAPSIVRFQLTPTPLSFDALARRRYRAHERHLVGARHLGSDHGAPLSTLDRVEMSNAGRTQNRSMFWLEVAVAADDAAVCKTIAAALQARRGENRLRRIVGTQGTYQRRFPRALTPLIPSPRSLVSSAEVAHLLALPSARMKGVPVRRMTVPRIPAPPQALRATEDSEIPVPRLAPPPAAAPATVGARI